MLAPVLLLAAACGTSPQPEAPAVSLRLVAAEPTLRFPKSVWTFDLRLANRGPVARWFLIPDPPEKQLGLERGADAVDVVAVGPAGARVFMLRIWATHNLLALRLAPGAEVELAGLALTSWQEEPLASIEIWAVRDLLLDGAPLGREHLGSAGVLVSDGVRADAGRQERMHRWEDPEMAAHPLTYAPDERWLLAIEAGEIPPPWAPSPGPSD